MRHTILTLLLLLLFSSAMGQTCTDWSQSRELPRSDAALTADFCFVDETTAFLVDSVLTIVDLADPDAALVTGSLDLPAPASDILVRDGLVYLIMDGYGMVEVDISAPADPVLTRSIITTSRFIDMADLDPYLALLDDQSRIHYIDPAPGRPLAEVSVQEPPLDQVRNIGRIGDYLAVWNGNDVVVMDVTDPLLPQETDSAYLPGDTAEFGPDYMIAQYHEFSVGTILTTVRVDGAGQITMASRYGVFQDQIHALAASRGRFCILGDLDGSLHLYLFSVDGMNQTAQYMSDDFAAVGLSPERLAWVSLGSGFHWTDVTDTTVIPAMVSFGQFPRGSDCTYENLGYECWSTDGQLSGHFWVEEKHDTFSHDGEGSGFTNYFNVYDLGSPLQPQNIYQTTGKATVMVWNDQWILRNESWCNDASCFCRHWFQLIDPATGTVIQDLYDSTLAGFSHETLWLHKWGVQDGCVYYRSTLNGYQVGETGDLTEIVDLGPLFGYMKDFDKVVILKEGGILNAYDFADTSNTRLLSSMPMDGQTTVWDNKTIYFTNQNMEVRSIDYNQPASPVPRLLFTTLEAVASINIDGDMMVLIYTDGSVQLAQPVPGGGWNLVSPILMGEFHSAFVIGNQLYLNSPNGLYLYDITDPAHPVYVGMAEGGRTGVGETGGYLVSEGHVLELDCGLVRDLVLTMTPADDPVVIPAAGGSFGFTVTLEVPEAARVRGVIDAVLPTGEVVTIRTPPPFDLGPGPATWTDLVQEVPPGAPAGVYTYRCTVSDGAGRTATDMFTFEKLPGGGFTRRDLEWPLTGWGLRDDPRREPGRAAGLEVTVAPNPFNPTTTLGFSLPGEHTVSLGVFDIQGNRVRNLMDGVVLGAGRHEVVWDGRNDAGRMAASGVYFYRLEAGADRRIGSMILIK